MNKIARRSGLVPEFNKWVELWHKARMTNLNDWLFLLLPIAVWFSYHPLIEIGQSETMYLEISLTLIFLFLFSVTALPHILRARKELAAKKSVWLVGAFALWNTATIFWSENTLRAILTAGVIWLLAIVFARIISHTKIKQLLPALLKIFVASALVVSIFAWVQMLLDIVGVPMEQTLICIGCQYEYFGFPRAVGFAIEPQFFGSLLLAPILLLIHFARKTKVTKTYYFLIGFLTLTLFMTLSRGAIYAFIIGLIVLFILEHKTSNSRVRNSRVRPWKSLGVVAVGFLLSLAAQGAMVALNPNVYESFPQGVAKSLHHLTLGTVDFREIATSHSGVDQGFSKDKPASSDWTTGQTWGDGTENEVYFDGYVAESTDARLSFNQLAFDAWTSSPQALLFGVGLGSAGVAMHNTHPDQIGQLEITQNEYTEIPLELGLIGTALFVVILVGFFRQTRYNKWVWAVAATFLVQWMFFSGYPNAIHIYFALFILFLFDKKSDFGKIA